MLKTFSSLKGVLLIATIVVLSLGAQIYHLSQANKTLASEKQHYFELTLSLKATDQANQVAINALEAELASFNSLSKQQTVKHLVIEKSVEVSKKDLNKKLQVEQNENKYVWADNPLPDAVAVMLNNSRSYNSNESGESAYPLAIDSGYSDTEIRRENEPRAG